MITIAGFFVPGFPKLLRYQEHFNKVLKKFLPKIKKHLVNGLFMLDEIYSSLVVSSLPIIKLRFEDYFLYSQ